ncbi:MAG: septum formation initiator family protein [Candidatus Parcubacteria bacterium]|nr:septum formation initiator family protein [Candidatus Parcubacteria bacterium]
MQERRKNRIFFSDLILSKFFLIGCLVIFFVILFGLAKGTIKNHQVSGEIKDLEDQIQSLSRQNQEFSQLIEFLKSDAYVEQEAKLKLGLKKTGENLVVIPQPATNLLASKNEVDKGLFNPVKWWAYFFK